MIYTNVGTLENNADYAWGICIVNIYGEVFRLIRVLRESSRWNLRGSFETLYCYSIENNPRLPENSSQVIFESFVKQADPTLAAVEGFFCFLMKYCKDYGIYICSRKSGLNLF